MSKNNDSSDAILAIGVFIVIAFVAFAFWLKKVTGLPFETLQKTGGLIVLVTLVVGVGRWLHIVRFRQHWNWIIPTYVIAFIPALNVWGAGIYYEDPLFLSGHYTSAQWYSNGYYQAGACISTFLSKYVYLWLNDEPIF